MATDLNGDDMPPLQPEHANRTQGGACPQLRNARRGQPNVRRRRPLIQGEALDSDAEFSEPLGRLEEGGAGGTLRAGPRYTEEDNGRGSGCEGSERSGLGPVSNDPRSALRTRRLTLKISGPPQAGPLHAHVQVSRWRGRSTPGSSPLPRRHGLIPHGRESRRP